MAQDNELNPPINSLGHTEYPKWVGEGDNRKVINDKFEEDAFNKNLKNEATSAWTSQDSKAKKS